MYANEMHDDTMRLDEQIAQDESGELRDRLIDELYLAVREIEAALAANTGPASPETLRNLLEAVQLSETVVVDAWHAFHG